MHTHSHNNERPLGVTCCPCGCGSESDHGSLTRRGFLEGMGGAALGSMALAGMSWSRLAAEEPDLAAPPPRRPLVVKPVFVYTVYTPRPQTSWRSWGGVQTQADADREVTRIQDELEKLKKSADFPVEFLPVTAASNQAAVKAASDLADADVVIVYAAGSARNDIFDALPDQDKLIFFVRHESGPLYLWYEIIHPRYLRRHTDDLASEAVDYNDVVVDSQEEMLWRLRALAGLQNTLGTRILAVGGPGGWAQPRDVITKLATDRWKLDIQTITYPELGTLIKAAREDQAEMALARQRADAYLKLPGTTLETKREFVDDAFLLEQVFRKLMAKAECRAITINQCMTTILPVSRTTACLPLSTLNDDGYLAFCESDFVTVPVGILLGSISGLPPFLHNPTYPHKGRITLAHCTGPRKMDGKTLEPTRIVTHYESDYGAAPKVEMAVGQKLTSIIPDFSAERFSGLASEITAHPFLPICRTQIEVRYQCSDQTLLEQMRGFHWMTVYGDYLREVGYALKKIPIAFNRLD